MPTARELLLRVQEDKAIEKLTSVRAEEGRLHKKLFEVIESLKANQEELHAVSKELRSIAEETEKIWEEEKKNW